MTFRITCQAATDDKGIKFIIRGEYGSLCLFSVLSGEEPA